MFEILEEIVTTLIALGILCGFVALMVILCGSI
jgi:nitrogen fixation-related uncharacterized protein